MNNKLSTRQQNLQIILNLLDEHSQLSAKELANLTGLSIVSINKLLDIINSKSNIITNDFLNTKGRRAKVYKINYDAKSLGVLELVEIDKKMMAIYYLTNLRGQARFKTLSHQEITSIKQLTKFIKTEISENKPDRIIIGFPGAALDGYLQTSDIKDLQGINLSQTIQNVTGISTTIVNDANASTYGAARELNESQNIAVGLYFPHYLGLGIGIVINNQLINGADGLAGEAQYSTISSDLNAVEKIIQYTQNIISFLNPNLIIIYTEKIKLTDNQIETIKQTLKKRLPVFQNYRLDFKRNFENDYLIGLATIGRQNILKEIIID